MTEVVDRFREETLAESFKTDTFAGHSIPLPIVRDIRMKFTSTLFVVLLFLVAPIAGCGSKEPGTSTEGASAQDIADYEAAVAAAEGSMGSSASSSAEERPATAGQ